MKRKFRVKWRGISNKKIWGQIEQGITNWNILGSLEGKARNAAQTGQRFRSVIQKNNGYS